MMFSRIAAAIIVIAATLWIGSGVLGRTEKPAEATANAPAAEAEAPRPLFKVAVIAAKVESHSGRLMLSGRTEADDRASAVTRTPGSIVELNVRRGDTVKEGDLIATLSDEARAAQVAQAEALVHQRQTELEAKQQLIKRGVMASNEVMQLEANLSAAQGALALAKAEFDRGLVKAPITGMVSDVPVTTGQALDTGAVVAKVIALDPMLAVSEVAERQLKDIALGTTATVRLVTGQTETGKVRYISPTASSGTRTYRVEVTLANADHAISDGVTAEMAFQLPPVDAVRVPRSALTFSAAGVLSVRTVTADGVVGSAAVTIVEDKRDEVWLTGLADGQQVIVQGQDFVKDGQQVEPVPADTQSPELISRS